MFEATVADTFETPDLPSAETRLAQAAGARNAAEAQLVALIADALEADSWRGHGVRSIEHWITWKLGANPGRARRYLAIARRRRELRTAHALFDRGRLSVDQMVLISRRCPTEYECSVSEFAVLATIPQLARCLRDYHFDYENPGPGPGTDESNTGADPREDPVPEPEAPAPIQGEVSFSLDEDRYRLVVSGPAADGIHLKAAIAQALSQLSEEQDLNTEWCARSYDAILHLLDRGIAADPSVTRQRRCRVLIHLDLDQRDRWASRLHLGSALTRAQHELLTCEADAAVLLEQAGRPLRLGRTSRIVPDALRSVIVDRDGGCRVPGCGRTLGLDVHHIRHWSNGGGTDPDNLVTLCRRHHTQLHQGQITIAGNPEHIPRPGRPDGLRFCNLHGDRLTHQPPSHDPPETGSTCDRSEPPTYQHPLGERLQPWAVHFERGAPDSGN